MYLTRGYPIDLELRRAHRARRRRRRPILSALLQHLRPPRTAREPAPPGAHADHHRIATPRADPLAKRPDPPSGTWGPASSGRLELRWQPTSTLHRSSTVPSVMRLGFWAGVAWLCGSVVVVRA
jgi:hypothetical protein